MPFGRWENWQACIIEMMQPPNNYSEDIAEATCGKLQARLEGKERFKILKSQGNRRVIAQYVTVENVDKDHDIIPLHRFKDALEEMWQWDPAYLSIHWKHTSYKIGKPLRTFTDESGTVHRTEVDEYGLYGITEIRNDGYKKADEVWGDILAGRPWGASIAVHTHPHRPTLLNAEIVKEKGYPAHWVGQKYWDVPFQFIEPWSETRTPANQYVTAAQILSKSECVPCVEARARWYIDQGLYKHEQWVEAVQHAQEYFEANPDVAPKPQKTSPVSPRGNNSRFEREYSLEQSLRKHGINRES